MAPWLMGTGFEPTTFGYARVSHMDLRATTTDTFPTTIEAHTNGLKTDFSVVAPRQAR